MGKIYDRIIAVLNSIGIDKYLHFIAGLVIAAFFNIVLAMEVCIVPVIFAGFIKEAIDDWRYGGWCWWDFLATIIGGAVIQAFVVF